MDIQCVIIRKINSILKVKINEKSKILKHHKNILGILYSNLNYVSGYSKSREQSAPSPRKRMYKWYL